MTGFSTRFFNYIASSTTDFVIPTAKDLLPPPPPAKQYQFPVLILTQDYGGLDANLLQSICMHWAQAGWFVVSVKHLRTPNALPHSFDNQHILSRRSSLATATTTGLPDTIQNPFYSQYISSGRVGSRAVVNSRACHRTQLLVEAQTTQLSLILDYLMGIHYGHGWTDIQNVQDHEHDAHPIVAMFKGRLNLEQVVVMGRK
jgi:hypothetical protein